MSTSFTTSPDSGLSCPHTPPRAPTPLAESSPVGKVYKYFLPENRDQYQKFGFEETLLGKKYKKNMFLKFLKVKTPKSVPDVPSRGMESFITLANKVAQSIKDQHFPNHNTLKFRDTGSKSPPGHVTDTKCRPDITAAFENDWKKSPGGEKEDEDVVSWPFIRLAGETASAGASREDQKTKAISYLHYLLLARPDLYVAQGLLSSENTVIFYFGIGGEGIRQFEVEWKDQEFNKLLYAFIYRLYEPRDFVDPSYIKTEFDEETTAKYTIRITDQGSTKDCGGFYSIYARNPFATRTHVLSNLNLKVEGNNLTVLKDQFCRVKRRFKELTILNEYVHKPERVPGVVVAAYGEQIKIPLSKERRKHRLGLGESGSPFTSIPTLSKVLETLFDVLEVLRYLRVHRRVLHRDISSGNVLYVENSSKHLLPPNSVFVHSDQEAKTTGLPLCYAKYLLAESDDPLETSMLLVDFNLAEHLEQKTRVKGLQIKRTGTPLFIARAVERGGFVPLPGLGAIFSGIPNSPGIYAEVHPDRVEKFPSSTNDLFIGADTLKRHPPSPGEFRHELNHDAESVFWLLLYWAMVVQPEGSFSKERIDAPSWSSLNGNHESRQDFIMGGLSHITHSFYSPLRPLIKDLAAILVHDSHWIPGSDPRKDPLYIAEAFQRLIIDFIIKNRGKEFMDHRVNETFRKAQDVQFSHGSAFSRLQSLDAGKRGSADQGPDNVEMDSSVETDSSIEMDSSVDSSVEMDSSQ